MTDREEKNDEYFMREAIKLARRGGGYTSPNPRVGAVIVKNGRIIGEGWHKRFGTLHAERNAIADLKEDAKGATLYVTLEPCCHYGKTPPCTEAIIASGIKRVVAGSSDPNPLVAGKGFRILEDDGIEVVSGVLEKECEAVNKPFFKFFREKKPFVTMKYAMTLDGKIATASGESQWITGWKARADVHEKRALNMAVMTGMGTVLKDDPMLDVRDAEGISPVRVVCDTRLRTPLDSKLVQTAAYDHDAVSDCGTVTVDGRELRVPRTIIATAVTSRSKLAPYIEAGCEIVNVSRAEGGGIDLSELMEKLGEKNIDSVWIEAGGTLCWSAAKSGIVDAVAAYVSPKILGGSKALTPVEGAGFEHLADCLTMTHTVCRAVGSDILIECDVKKRANRAVAGDKDEDQSNNREKTKSKREK
ncbi:MAG: bifunctional diaminohydroxyphosphoribosylaminopyrimidine deaminase/5-amino-6-(5-phosphoribosylamino)uracil reductase RibD [Anaerovoracaceae bacterium]